MRPLDELLADVVGALVGQFEAASAEHRVVDLDLTLPIESRFATGTGLLASLPRGRMLTGFQVAATRMRLRLDWRAP